MQRRAEREHHVVRHVDDVRDRSHAGGEQARLQPGGARANRRAAEDSPDVSRTRLQIVDAHIDALVTRRFGVAPRRRRQLGAGQRCDLTCDPVDGREVGPVETGLDLEHGLGERQHVAERRTRLELVGEHHDPAVIGAELELALGEDHPAGELAAELGLAQRLLRARQQRTGERDGDGRSGAEVPRAAHDLARLAFPDVDEAELEPVGVRVLAGFDDASDEEGGEVSV